MSDKLIRDTSYIDDKLKRLKKIWRAFPELRLGQIIGNCVNYPQLYYLSDDEILKIIESQYLEQAEARLIEKKKRELAGGRTK